MCSWQSRPSSLLTASAAFLECPARTSGPGVREPTFRPLDSTHGGRHRTLGCDPARRRCWTPPPRGLARHRHRLGRASSSKRGVRVAKDGTGSDAPCRGPRNDWCASELVADVPLARRVRASLPRLVRNSTGIFLRPFRAPHISRVAHAAPFAEEPPMNWTCTAHVFVAVASVVAPDGIRGLSGMSGPH